MDVKIQKMLSEQLEKIATEYHQYRNQSRYKDASDVISNTQVRQMKTRALAAIERATGRGSVYFEQAQVALGEKRHDWNHLAALIGIVESAKIDIQSGYLSCLEELIHADIFSDFLEMADYLLSSGYKDASAVIAGSTLEVHIKQLCAKFGVNTLSSGKPKKADMLNAELVKSSAYSKLDQKNITAWLGLRNDAAHGDYNEYDKQQVSLLINSIRDFVTRNPA